MKRIKQTIFLRLDVMAWVSSSLTKFLCLIPNFGMLQPAVLELLGRICPISESHKVWETNLCSCVQRIPSLRNNKKMKDNFRKKYTLFDKFNINNIFLNSCVFIKEILYLTMKIVLFYNYGIAIYEFIYFCAKWLHIGKTDRMGLL
jgi:hypothetical protein